MMTLNQLIEKVTIKRLQQCSYKVTIEYRGKCYSCVSHNSIAWDDFGSEFNRSYYKTDKQCLKAFYDECKRKNNL